jgi:hypothetical protein
MPERTLPSKSVLERWYNDGMNYAEMARRHNKATNQNLTRQAFFQACKRLGISEPANFDHSAVLPPNLRPEHTKLYDTQMIRKWDARRQGKVYGHREDQKINGWLANLNDAKAVLLYKPNTQKGWHTVPRLPSDEPDFPMRRTWVKAA